MIRVKPKVTNWDLGDWPQRMARGDRQAKAVIREVIKSFFSDKMSFFVTKRGIELNAFEGTEVSIPWNELYLAHNERKATVEAIHRWINREREDEE